MPHRSLTFHGASGAVTGSCFRLETDAGQILIDCGMFQGSKTEKELNSRPFPFAPEKVAAVILNHAHIDHSGLCLPPRFVSGAPIDNHQHGSAIEWPLPGAETNGRNV